MADAMPNYALNKRRVELEKIQHEANIVRSEVRILELEDEKAKIMVNLEATRKVIAELNEKIKMLDEAAKQQAEQPKPA